MNDESCGELIGRPEPDVRSASSEELRSAHHFDFERTQLIEHSVMKRNLHAGPVSRRR